MLTSRAKQAIFRVIEDKVRITPFDLSDLAHVTEEFAIAELYRLRWNSWDHRLYWRPGSTPCQECSVEPVFPDERYCQGCIDARALRTFELTRKADADGFYSDVGRFTVKQWFDTIQDRIPPVPKEWVRRREARQLGDALASLEASIGRAAT